MELKAMAEALVTGCREGREMENLDRLYAPDAVSVEAQAMGEMGRETKGLEGIRGKHHWWNDNFEVHEAKVEGPYLHGDDRFGVVFTIDATNKGTGERNKMHEIAVYHVGKGKIVREEFFY